MKSGIKQVSPNKAYRLFEQSRMKGSVYFSLPGSNKIMHSRSACLHNGFIYCEIYDNGHYSGYRIDTLAGNPVQPAFVSNNSFISPF